MMEFKSSSEAVDFKERKELDETNDCAVIAVAAATGASYKDAHEYCRVTFGRKAKKGTFLQQYLLANAKFEMLGKEAVKMHPNSYTKLYKRSNKRRANTISTFVDRHPKGTFIVLVRKHAFTVVDGVAYDHDGLLGKTARKVIGAIQIK